MQNHKFEAGQSSSYSSDFMNIFFGKKSLFNCLFPSVLGLGTGVVWAQDSLRTANLRADSVYIAETESPKTYQKVLHAEPLFVDLLRDLGARKGEKEWNVGIGMTDRNSYTQYNYLIEYEWAPLNRLGLEIEVPVNLYSRHLEDTHAGSIPESKIRGLKAGVQYTVLSSEQLKLSAAIGYLHEWEISKLRQFRSGALVNGQVLSPFWVVAKRWGNNLHSLIYQGPIVEKHHDKRPKQYSYQLHTNVHYMIPGTRNFVGIEVNQLFESRSNHTVFRPQMRLCLADNLMVGIVAGISTWRQKERFSSFLRLIYEPKHPPRKV